MTFGPLEISFDETVLRPRPWTTQQAHWAAEILAGGPEGPVLELCAGAGQIGLLAISIARRPLVCVDSSADACGFARANGGAAGLADLVEVREGDLELALRADERFAVVIADPPWVRSSEIRRFPEDPPPTIDGGRDGLDGARACLGVAARHLLPGGAIVLQLGDRDQAAALGREVSALEVCEVRDGADGVLVLLRRSDDARVGTDAGCGNWCRS